MVLGVWMIKLCLFLILVSKLSNAGYSTKLDFYPLPCERIECPDYELIESGKDYEIRLIILPCGCLLLLLMILHSFPAPQLVSKVHPFAEKCDCELGLGSLYNYRHGKNIYKEEIGMTVPVLAQVKPSDGPFSTSSFVVSFYIPKKNQPNPPPAKGLHLQKWSKTYVAVRQFSGFVIDDDIPKEAAALSASIAGTKWAEAVEKSQAADDTTVYKVAQYNSPSEFNNRVNEIWFTFDLDKASAI
ncbi:putative heme-binding protein 2-like [Capsicum annuum]|nr:putative heme-binding protein 2-like [Capsicum annuum]